MTILSFPYLSVNASVIAPITDVKTSARLWQKVDSELTEDRNHVTCPCPQGLGEFLPHIKDSADF